jgi:hypothetical protein
MKDLGILLAACAVFLLSPYLPSILLKLLVGNYLGAAVLILAASLMLKRSVTAGVATFLAVSALFLENRRRTVETVQVQMARAGLAGAPVEQLNKPAEDLIPGEVHPKHEEATVEEYGYEPSEEEGGGSKLFESPSAVEDEKGVLEGVPSNDTQGQAEGYVGRGLASAPA